MDALVRLLVALILAGSLMWAVEKRWPALDRPRFRPGMFTDLLYWFFTPLVTRTITVTGLVVAVLALGWVQGIGLSAETGIEPLIADAWVQTLPGWVQGVLLVLTLDFLGYWIHRWFHRGRLWAFHAVHHSSIHLDWLSSVRIHPVNDLIGGVIRVVIALVLGFDPLHLAVAVPFFAVHGLLLHANVHWDFGPLRYVLASPRFHRWHHTSEREGLDRNFAGLFPIWDLVFGTLYLPRDRQPEVFGTVDPLPTGLFGQLWYPFRKPPSACSPPK